MVGNDIFDIAIIGGGIIGTGIAYELSKYNVSIALIEKSSQVTQGASKGNSGILHAGYDSPDGSLRAKLVVRGNKRYDDWEEEIGAVVKRVGSFVVAFDDYGIEYIKKLKKRGDARGIPLEILDEKAVKEAEPNINPGVIAALYAPTAGSICPMRFVNFLFKNAVVNGVKPFLASEVVGFKKQGGEIVSIETLRGEIHAKLVINAAGVFGDVVSKMAGINDYTIIPRKGQYILLEPHPSYNVNHIIFPIPTRESKGVLVVPTETGDILLGPTAENMEEEFKEDTTTTVEGLREVVKKTKELVPSLSTRLTVKTFAGNRAQSNTNDFIIEGYDNPSNFINVIGIRSPGLTSAPAIADMVVELVESIAGTMEKKPRFRTYKFKYYNQTEEAIRDIEWANTLTPNLDSPSIPMLNEAWEFGIRDNLYNFSCYSGSGLGVDLGCSFQNELIEYLKKRGTDYGSILFRLAGSVQVERDPS